MAKKTKKALTIKEKISKRIKELKDEKHNPSTDKYFINRGGLEELMKLV